MIKSKNTAKYKISKKRFIKVPIQDEKELECINWLNNQLSKDIYYQKKERQNIISLDLLKEKGFEPSSSSLMEEIDKKEEYLKLYKAIKQLTTKQKQVIVKHFFEDQSLRSIASYYGVSHVTIHEILHNALKKMAKEITKNQ